VASHLWKESAYLCSQNDYHELRKHYIDSLESENWYMHISSIFYLSFLTLLISSCNFQRKQEILPIRGGAEETCEQLTEIQAKYFSLPLDVVEWRRSADNRLLESNFPLFLKSLKVSTELPITETRCIGIVTDPWGVDVVFETPNNGRAIATFTQSGGANEIKISLFMLLDQVTSIDDEVFEKILVTD
jgi:hypothetical protein